MCTQATCQACGKTTWSGCGRHVDQVMSRVPAAQQCTCGPAATKSGSGHERRGLFARFRR